MSYSHRFTVQTLKQQDEIITWYARQSAKAAEQFVEGLYEIVDKICADPYLYRNAYKAFREFYWKRFRYHIISFMNEKDKEGVIFSLYHASRNPGNKFAGL